MTPRELPKYEVLFSFRSLLFYFYLVGRGRAFLPGRAHPILKFLKSFSSYANPKHSNRMFGPGL